MKNFGLKTFLLSLLGIFIGSFVCILGITLATKLIGWPAWKQDISLRSSSGENYFSADGQVTLEAIPDQAVINLGVEITDKTVADAQNQVNTIVTSLQSQLNSLGITEKDIRTQNYSVYPNYNWDKGASEITGYTVNSTLQVTCTDFALLNQVIDAATKLGINQVNNVAFTLSDAKKAELKKEARKEAIAQAKSNAQELASLAGIKLGNITNVWENELNSDVATNYVKSMALNEAGSDSVATDLQAGTTSYSYQVSLTYQTF